MPRPSEIKAEESLPARSPLKRSCRIVAVSSPAPSEVKPIRGRRSSVAKNETKDEETHNEPKSVRATRASSIMKEDPEPKPEPAKTRSRRSSATIEPVKEEKKPAATRGRRPSATEEPEASTPKPVRGRRASATAEEDKTKEEEVAKKPVRARRGSVQEEKEEEPEKKPVRGRRSSVDDKEEERPPQRSSRSRKSPSRDKVEENHGEGRMLRSRRSSVESIEPKEDTKPLSKPKRRLSITESVVQLDPIEESPKKDAKKSLSENVVIVLEPIDETSPRSSKTPTKDEKTPKSLTPIKKKDQQTQSKGSLDLSVISENSFNEEIDKLGLDEDATSRRSVSPRIASLKSDSPVRKSPRLREKLEKCKSGELHAHTRCSCEESSPDTSGRKKIDFDATKTSPDAAENLEEKEKLNDSVFLSEETENAPKTHISDGSDGSFRFHMSSKIESTEDENELEVSKTSDSSDKENVAQNEDVATGKKILEDFATIRKEIPLQNVTLSRVSNVFRPKNVDCSFLEPMEVDITMDSSKLDKSLFKSKMHNESMDETFSLSLSISQIETPTDKEAPGIAIDVDEEVESSSKFDKKESSEKVAEELEELLRAPEEKTFEHEEVATIEEIEDARPIEEIEIVESDLCKSDNEGDDIKGMSDDYDFDVPSEEEDNAKNVKNSDALTLKNDGKTGDDEERSQVPHEDEEGPIVEEERSDIEDKNKEQLMNETEGEETTNENLEENVPINEDLNLEGEGEKDDQNEETIEEVADEENYADRGEKLEKSYEKEEKDDFEMVGITATVANQKEEENLEELDKMESSFHDVVKDDSNSVTERKETTSENEDEQTVEEKIEEIHREEKDRETPPTPFDKVKRQSRGENKTNIEDNSTKTDKEETKIEDTKTKRLSNEKTEVKDRSSAHDSQLEEDIKENNEEEEQLTEILVDSIIEAETAPTSPRKAKRRSGRAEENKIVENSVELAKEEMKSKKRSDGKTDVKDKSFAINSQSEENIEEEHAMEILEDKNLEVETAPSSKKAKRRSRGAEKNKIEELVKEGAKDGESKTKRLSNEKNDVKQRSFTLNSWFGEEKPDEEETVGPKVNDETWEEEIVLSEEIESQIGPKENEEIRLSDGAEQSFKKSKKVKKKTLEEIMGREDSKLQSAKKLNHSSEEVAISPKMAGKELEEIIRANASTEEATRSASKKKRRISSYQEGNVKVEKKYEADASPLKQSLEVFANSKLDEYLQRKMADFEAEERETISDEESDNNNSFIDDMAEEGEEDTPSEDSNQIIEDGESLHSDSDRSDDDYEEDDDSFVCDEEKIELLSGDEYDLEDVPKKKSRIINVENMNEDVIKIEKKPKPERKRKKSRIIKVVDSSDEEIVDLETDTEEKSNEKQESTGRRSSINIIENIDVKEIKDTVLSQRINQLVDSFCTTIPSKGGVSMNLSLEYAPEEFPEEENKSRKRRSKGDAEIPAKEPRLSISLTENSDKPKLGKRRLSRSMEDLSGEKKKRRKKKSKLNQQTNTGASSSGELRHQTFGLMNQLLNDVKNRPKRVIKPGGTTLEDVNCCWIVEDIQTIKPSTSIVSKREMQEFKKMKFHSKDFRNQMLYNSSRVRRMETKDLLRKKTAYY